MNHQLILASTSPRRHSLLRKLGLRFEVVGSDVTETIEDNWSPAEAVRNLAGQKADVVAELHPEQLVLAADTIVVLDGEILGKPETPDEAAAMLSRLSGRVHEVLTGVALVHQVSGRRVVDHETTYVRFDELRSAEIAAYVATGSPLDKAGAYGIQDDRGCLFIRGVEGDYYNVVGLPLNLVYRLTNRHFSDLRVF